MAVECYPVPAASLVVEEEIKHSRFISFLFHCESEESLKCVLTNMKEGYPGASHYCYGFVASDPTNSVLCGASDDGEPAGSAGRPILATLQGAGIGEIGAVVVRFYGGTKLGVGGLVRAYTSGVKQGLSQLATRQKQIRYPGVLSCSYAQLKDIEYFLDKYDCVVSAKEFTENVHLQFEIPQANKISLEAELATLSQGTLKAQYPDTI